MLPLTLTSKLWATIQLMPQTEEYIAFNFKGALAWNRSNTLLTLKVHVFEIYGSRCSRMAEVKFVEDSL